MKPGPCCVKPACVDPLWLAPRECLEWMEGLSALKKAAGRTLVLNVWVSSTQLQQVSSAVVPKLAESLY